MYGGGRACLQHLAFAPDHLFAGSPSAPGCAAAACRGRVLEDQVNAAESRHVRRERRAGASSLVGAGTSRGAGSCRVRISVKRLKLTVSVGAGAVLR